MIEGYEKQQLAQQVDLINTLQRIPFTANWVNLDQSSMAQISSAIRESIEEESERIEKAHRDTILEAADEELRQANAFAEVLKRRNKQKGG